MNAVRQYVMNRVVIHPKSKCWIWTNAQQGGGYGKAKFQGKQSTAHRLSYIAFEGPIASGLCLDHICRNRLCVNPLHLEPVTQVENRRRGLQMSLRVDKTHCINGHPYTDGNTYKDRKGVNRCMECARQTRMRSYWRIKECQKNSL